jgi:hypothetical protein
MKTSQILCGVLVVVVLGATAILLMPREDVRAEEDEPKSAAVRIAELETQVKALQNRLAGLEKGDVEIDGNVRIKGNLTVDKDANFNGITNIEGFDHLYSKAKVGEAYVVQIDKDGISVREKSVHANGFGIYSPTERWSIGYDGKDNAVVQMWRGKDGKNASQIYYVETAVFGRPLFVTKDKAIDKEK